MASQAEKGVIEPQFVEFLASSAYALLGGEALWVPRLLSISFWTLGALFLFLAVRRLVGRVGAPWRRPFSCSRWVAWWSRPAGWQPRSSPGCSGDRIVGLVPDYGHAFRFFGWRDYRWWAATFDWALMEDEDFAGYWPRRTEGMGYFLVTDFGQYYAQPDLRQHLETKCRMVAQQESYWVLDLAGEDCAQH